MIAEIQQPVIITIAIILGIFAGIIILLLASYKKVPQGQALVRTGLGGHKATFSGILVLPSLHKAHYIDTTYTRLLIDWQGKHGITCKDNVRINIMAAYFVRINNTVEDVTKAIQSFGIEKASDKQVAEDLFSNKVREAILNVSKQLDFDELDNNRVAYGKQILDAIDKKSNGYILENVIIEDISKIK